MNKHTNNQLWYSYIETPRHTTPPVKIDVVLKQRMNDFMLSRRRMQWQESGE